MDSPTEGAIADGLFFDDMMADSQISNLELSSELLARNRSYPASTPPSSRPSSHKPTPPRRLITKHAAPARNSERREIATSNDRTATFRYDRRDSSTSIDSWESETDFIDRRQVPRQPIESQQDLAERIGSLTRTINANAAFCLEVSGKMVELARENKHLLDASKSTLETYVLQPALKIPGILKAYCPGIQDGLQDGLVVLREYEAQLRRTVRNCANGRDMARAQGVVGGGIVEGSPRRGEMSRLKDRLVEQDVLLRDSSQHVQRLIREREALKKQLHQRQRDSQGQETELASLDVNNPEGQGFIRPSDVKDHENGLDEEQPDSEKDMAALADHLSEMRMLMDRLALHEV